MVMAARHRRLWHDVAVADELESEAPGEHAVAPGRAAELIAAARRWSTCGGRTSTTPGTWPGAANIEMNELPARSAEIPRDRPVLFYCRSGNRSGMAVDAFREAGYEAHNLAGGIERLGTRRAASSSPPTARSAPPLPAVADRRRDLGFREPWPSRTRPTSRPASRLEPRQAGDRRPAARGAADDRTSRSRACAPGSPRSTASSASAASPAGSRMVLALAAGHRRRRARDQRQGRERDQGRGRRRCATRSRPRPRRSRGPPRTT